MLRTKLLAASTVLAGGALALSARHQQIAHTTAAAKAPAAGSGSAHGADCKEVACSSALDSFQKSMGKAGKKNPGAEDQPPNREALGRAGWTILHAFAAYYPDQPTDEEKTMARAFLDSFAHFYPCKDCAEGFRIAIETDPPKLDSRKDFSIWICQMHNRVNEQLGKPVVPCDIATLDKRWRGH